MYDEQKYISILKEELVPALGCTEPIALAFAAAKCASVLGGIPEHTEAHCSGNIIKNVKGVVVPGCGGMKGIETAVSAGLLFGKASAGLEVLSGMNEQDIPVLKEYLATNPVSVSLLESTEKLHIVISMFAGCHSALVEIKGVHTGIVRIEKDNELVFSSSGCDSPQEVMTDRSCLSVEDIIAFAENVDVSKLEEVIGPQIDINSRICEEGIEHDWGAAVGKTILEKSHIGGMGRVEALAAAGSDARMSGCCLPVIINSGSGNQGITVSVPVIEYAREHGIGRERLLRALAISNLLAIHQKTGIGRLSAFCGAVSAACGAGAAMTWLSGGSPSQVDETIVNTLATVSGMMCDGAKPSCAGKIAVAVNAACLAHEMAMKGKSYGVGEGIVKCDVEKTVSSIGTIASVGMKDTDRVILSVMLEKDNH